MGEPLLPPGLAGIPGPVRYRLQAGFSIGREPTIAVIDPAVRHPLTQSKPLVSHMLRQDLGMATIGDELLQRGDSLLPCGFIRIPQPARQ